MRDVTSRPIMDAGKITAVAAQGETCALYFVDQRP